MAAPATQLATLVHLETGHVLAALTVLGAKPAVGDVVGDFLPVRVPGTSAIVNVPAALLTATSLAVTADVLERPQNYQLAPGNPLRNIDLPVILGRAAAGFTPGKLVVVVWQVGDESFTQRGTVDVHGQLPGKDLSLKASGQLAAVDGEKLSLFAPLPPAPPPPPTQVVG